jgi:hypothetical protein
VRLAFLFRPLVGPTWLVVNAARWVFHVDRECVGFFEQRRFKYISEWRDCGRYVGVWVYRPSGWGYVAKEYDGQHHVLHVGPVHIGWGEE